jgi:hypothetical protein
MTEYSLTTGQAAVWLTVKSKEINAKLSALDWYSFLQENRRNPVTDSALKRGAPRGNSHIFGRIGHSSEGRKARYSVTLLRRFLEELKLNLSRVEYLLKRVEG